MEWDTEADKIKFRLKRMDLLKRETTKRACLSTIYSIYDPLGLLAPVTVAAKIILRKVWAHRPHIQWDDTLPREIQGEWDSFRDSLIHVPELEFQRSLKPNNGTSPVLIILSDGSKQAYGAVAYLRWKTTNGYFSKIITAKSRIAPLKIIDTVRLELCGAVLNCRLYAFIKKEMPDVPVERVYHLVDSEIVKAMINKESYGFSSFAANRIGEIHRNSEQSNWYWIDGDLNIADIVTRPVHASELHEGSVWQNGPEFLKLDEKDWPIQSETNVVNIPEWKRQFVGTTTENKDTSLASIIDVNRFSNLNRLIYTTARINKLFDRFKKGGDKKDAAILPIDLKQAEDVWIKKAQEKIHEELNGAKYRKLQPRSENGIIVVGGRTEKWMEATWNRQCFILLPKDHRLSYLISLKAHKEIGHLATESTIAKIRSKYWIIGVRRIVNSITNKCVTCKKKAGTTEDGTSPN